MQKALYFRFRKTLSVEDELDVPEQLSGGDFVRAFSSIRLSTSEVVGTKLVVKGSAEIEAIYLVSGVPSNSAIFAAIFSVFTMPDGCTDPEVIACDMITGQYFEAFDGKLSADIRAAIQIICLQEQSVSYICDAYSCKKELSLSSSELCCLTGIDTGKRKLLDYRIVQFGLWCRGRHLGYGMLRALRYLKRKCLSKLQPN